MFVQALVNLHVCEIDRTEVSMGKYGGVCLGVCV